MPDISVELEFPDKLVVGFFLRVPMHFLIPQHLMIIPRFLFNSFAPAMTKKLKYVAQK